MQDDTQAQAAEQTAPAAPPITFRTTLGEYGALPIGIASSGGRRARSVAFKRWTMDDEIALGRLVSNDEEASALGFYSQILATFVTSLGDEDLSDMAHEKKLLRVKQLYAADFIAAWALLRIHAMGPKVPYEMTCPRCGRNSEKFRWAFDLTSAPLIVATDEHTLRRTIDLADGIEARKGVHKQVIIAPYRQDAYNVPRDNANAWALQVSFVRNAIVGLPGIDHDIVLSEKEAGKGIVKRDFETICAAIESDHLGIDWSAQVTCPKGHTFEHSVSWLDYGRFFSTEGSSM